jgi:alkylhydroperoxidase/carboxymuconolactone decarboxylase family protein YurZ
MSYLPDIYQHFERAFPNVHAAHQELAKACYEGGPLDPRSARLVKLGVAIGAQAEGAVRSHTRRALAENMTPRRGSVTSVCSPSRQSASRTPWQGWGGSTR